MQHDQVDVLTIAKLSTYLSSMVEGLPSLSDAFKPATPQNVKAYKLYGLVSNHCLPRILVRCRKWLHLHRSWKKA